ncbi:T9SS type A sorting domain-containing protein [Maribellus sediminis]|uniref:T9SS type A sorting domain-containing protein n=1 Tax=Maribellus sediminis TaxID=2696285 RepID=UPI00143139E7|nr:T9SS type A sorting domain-containing protein [Maribellus sediminis]
MKKLILLLITLIPLLSFSQNWADYNSVWHYSQINFATPPDLSYIKFEAIGDTVINGDTVKIILEEDLSRTDTISSKIFMKSDSGKVYLFIPEISSYQLIYDFVANTGDTIEVYCRQTPISMDSTITIRVDSVSNIDVNGNNLKVQYVSQIYSEGDEYYMEGEIIENIGWTGFMFPLHAWADPPYGGPLRCFQNDKTGLLKLTEIDCDYLTSNTIIEKQNQIKIYPNPAKNNILFNFGNRQIERIQIMDCNGRVSGNFVVQLLQEFNLSVEKYKPGFYFYKTTDNSGLIQTGKFVVQ